MKNKIIQLNDYLAFSVKHVKKGHVITIVRDNNPNLILKLKYDNKKRKTV